MTEIHGRAEPGFSSVREAFASCFAEGLEDGAAVAVVHDGEVVVDLWGGVRNSAGDPWNADTVVNVWSVSKTATAIALLVLVDEGRVDVDAPVARYWPEFAAAGKESVTVAHVLGHASGLPGWDIPVALEDLADWERMSGALAAQEPWWEPGTASGYQMVTHGFLIGEIVQRVTGQRFTEFFHDRFGRLIGDDLHFGADEEMIARAAELTPPGPRPSGPPEPGSIRARAALNPIVPAAAGNEAWWQRATIPAVNGLGSARAFAKLGGLLSSPKTAGVPERLGEETRSAVMTTVVDSVDHVLGVPVRFGLGFAIGDSGFPIGRPGRVAYWGGWGGGFVFCDLDLGLSVAYTTRHMEPVAVGDARGRKVLDAVYAAVVGEPADG